MGEMDEFLHLPSDSESINYALEKIEFSEIQEHESEDGFCEKPPKQDKFFRKGIIGDWQEELNKEQISKLIEDHHAVMQKIGYLDENDQPSTRIKAD